MVNSSTNAVYHRVFSGNQDYSTLSTSLTFLPGDTIGSPPRCVEINILDDDIVENEEEFTISMSSGSVIQAINVTIIDVTIYEDSSDGMFVKSGEIILSCCDN